MSTEIDTLLRATQAGEPPAWEALLKALRRHIAIWVARFDPRASEEERLDRIQACYEWIVRYKADIVGRFDAGKGSALWWLHQACTRALISHKRGQSTKGRSLAHAVEGSELEHLAKQHDMDLWTTGHSPDAERSLDLKGRLDQVIEYLEQRDELDRHVFWSCLANGVRPVDLALSLGVSEDLISQRKKRLLKALQDALPLVALAVWVALMLSSLLEQLAP